MRAHIHCLTLSALFTLFPLTTSSAKDPRNEPLIGYINPRGEIAIKHQFIKGSKFIEGVASAIPENAKLYGLIDVNGKIIVPPTFQTVGRFVDGLAPAANASGKYGYINKLGVFTIAPKYDLAREFNDGLAEVMVASPDSKNGDRNWGFVDASGTLVVQPAFEQVDRFSGGFAAVKLHDKWNYIDKKGKFLLTEWVDGTAYGFSDGRAPVLKNGLWGFIDSSGQSAITPMFSSISPFNNQHAMVALDRDRQIRIIDTSGRFVTEKQFPSMNHFCDGLAFIHDHGKVFCIDTRGNTVIPPEKLSGVENLPEFHQGLAAVRIAGKYGYINKTGDLVIAATLVQTDGFSESRARSSTHKGMLFFEE